MKRPLRARTNLVTVRAEHWTPPTYPPDGRDIRARALRFLDLQTGTIWQDLARELPNVTGTVVDVGCGLQPYRGLFGASVHYVGIDHADTSDGFIKPAADTIVYSGTRWPLGDEVADFVLCTETLEHVVDLEVFLSEMHRCLKPGGRVLLTVPFAARWHFIPYDYWRPTPSGLDHLLTTAGFTEVGVYGRGNQLTVACYKVMGFIFSLLSPQPSSLVWQWFCRAVGVIGLGPALAAAVVANTTKDWQGTVDFLGFTVVAVKPD